MPISALKTPTNTTIALEYKDLLEINVNINPSFEIKGRFLEKADLFIEYYALDNATGRVDRMIADSIFDILFFFAFTDFRVPNNCFDSEGILVLPAASDAVNVYRVRENLRSVKADVINNFLDQLENDFASRMRSHEQRWLTKQSTNTQLVTDYVNNIWGAN